MLPEPFRLDDKVAVVTGAGKPLARAIDEAFAEAGASVLAVSHEAAAVRDLGRDGQAVTADMTRAADVRYMADEALRRFGKIDVLLAGEEAVLAGPLGDLDEDEWDTVMSVNTKSVYLCSRVLGQQMVASGSGRIIVLSHALALAGIPNATTYAASKGAVIQFVRSLGLEWATSGVTVNAIAPGGFSGGWEDPEIDPLAHFIPMRRRGQPEELGPLAVYLASDSAAYVTAYIAVVDGGQICHA